MFTWLPTTRLAILFLICTSTLGCASKYSLRNPLVRASATPQLESSLETAAPSVNLNPEQKAEVQLALARNMEGQGRMDEAKKLYAEAVQNDLHSADACHRLALLLGRQGECQQANQYYQLAVERVPEDVELHCDAGYNLYLQQNWQDSEYHLRQALSLDPYHQRAHNNYGMLLARTGREETAMLEFSQAGCSEAEARTNLALALTLNDRWPEAQQQYQMAMTADPQLERARHASSVLQSVSTRQASFQPEASPISRTIEPVSYSERTSRPPLR